MLLMIVPYSKYMGGCVCVVGSQGKITVCGMPVALEDIVIKSITTSCILLVLIITVLVSLTLQCFVRSLTFANTNKNFKHTLNKRKHYE